MNSRHFHLSRLRSGMGILGISVVLTGANLLAQQTAPPGDQAPHAWRRFGQPPAGAPADQAQPSQAQTATDPAQTSADQAPPDQAQAGAPNFQNGPEAEPSAEPPQAEPPSGEPEALSNA